MRRLGYSTNTNNRGYSDVVNSNSLAAGKGTKLTSASKEEYEYYGKGYGENYYYDYEKDEEDGGSCVICDRENKENRPTNLILAYTGGGTGAIRYVLYCTVLYCTVLQECVCC